MRDRVVVDQYGRGRQAFRGSREATADQICDVGIPDAEDDFRFRSAMIGLDNAMLIDARVSAWRNDRNACHIARGGMDHYQMTLCLHGEMTYAAGRRIVTAAGIDHLRAEFNANAWSGRMEGGYRFVAPWSGGIGLTPYAAAQFTTIDLPAYAEQVISGASTFALSYGARSPTDTRSELGLRSDKSFAIENAVLTLRGRLAWAHDFDPDRALAATFQALPGASFVVNGAAQACDSALTTASAELKWTNGWSAAATFEGEFSAVTRSYAGKGVVRYGW